MAPFHVLVIPKGEYTCYNDFINNASQEEQIAFFKAVAEISEQNDLLDGYRIVSNIGSNARQMVPHFHFHIVGKKSFHINLWKEKCEIKLRSRAYIHHFFALLQHNRVHLPCLLLHAESKY